VAREIVQVSTLPVLGNGKTDYVALSDMASSGGLRAAEPEPPRPVERALGGGD
jgi:hypothetical protein